MKTIQTLLILLITTGMMAQNKIEPSIDVTGEGIVRVVPDEVRINIRVENTGENTKNLKEQNDATVNEVLKFLKKEKIEDKDIRTEYMNLSKDYDYNTKTYSFSANQAISIKLRDLKKYESVMKGIMDSGINRIDGIEFSSSNKIILEGQARKKAMENALMKAKEYAAVINQSVGKAILISEFSNQNGPQPRYKEMMMSSSASGSVDNQSISLGEIEIRTTINVSFLLN